MRPDDPSGGKVDWDQPVRTLLPGEPEDVLALAQTMLRWSVICSSTVSGLGNIDPDWSGAAQAAYEVKKAAHLDQWTKTADALDSAGGALLTYARVLADAQADTAVAKRLGLKATATPPDGQEGDEGPAVALLVSAEGAVAQAAARAVTLVGEATSMLPKVEEFEGITDGLSAKDWIFALSSPMGAGFVFGPRIVDKAPEIGKGIYDLTRPGSNDTKTDFGAGMLRGLIDLGLQSAHGIDQAKVSNNLDYFERMLGINPDSGAHGVGEFVGPLLIPFPGMGGLGEIGTLAGRAAEEAAAEAALRRALTAANRLGTADDLARVLKSKIVNVDWGADPRLRGLDVEAQAGGNLPVTFPTFDRFDTGVATSIKSLDLTAATYANNPRSITSTLNKYVDQVEGFTGAARKGVRVTSSMIDTRRLEIYVQSGKATDAQSEAIQATITYAQQHGVDIEVHYIP